MLTAEYNGYSTDGHLVYCVIMLTVTRSSHPSSRLACELARALPRRWSYHHRLDSASDPLVLFTISFFDRRNAVGLTQHERTGSSVAYLNMRTTLNYTPTSVRLGGC